MVKHKHNWQFKKSKAKIARYWYPRNKFYRFACAIVGITPVIEYDYYNVFCCECGEEKEVKIK